MLEFCEVENTNDASWDDFDAWSERQIRVLYGIWGVEIASWITGLVLIFGWGWRETKPYFVKVLWSLITLSSLALIAQIVLRIQYTRVFNEQDYEKSTTLRGYFQEAQAVTQCLVTISHWVFALKCFESVHNISSRKNHGNQKTSRCVIWSANASYFTITGLWLFVYQILYAYPLDESWNTERTYYLMQLTFNSVVRMIPAFLLVITMIKLSCLIEQHWHYGHMKVRERILCTYTVVFICNICVSLAAAASSFIAYNADDWSKECRAAVSSFFLSEIAQGLNVAILWIIILMSYHMRKQQESEPFEDTNSSDSFNSRPSVTSLSSYGNRYHGSISPPLRTLAIPAQAPTDAIDNDQFSQVIVHFRDDYDTRSPVSARGTLIRPAAQVQRSLSCNSI